MSLDTGDIITFDAKKNFTFIKKLGEGGTGDTYLFKDETTDILFAIKKYAPKDPRYTDEYYKRFVDEIKILFTLSHPNIVRVYNYYLYPDAKTGFLQMEYVDGKTIDQFTPLLSYRTWEDIFTDTISAFEYLEQHHILHRDIRPANIMLDNDDQVKIIDFGFGKVLQEPENKDNSILLNWPATEMPNEVQESQAYDERTEIYFVGTLFRHVIDTDMSDFKFAHIIEKMIKLNPLERYSSFSDIVVDLTAGVLGETDFTDEQKECYQTFADALTSHISHFSGKHEFVTDNSITIARLAELIKSSALEQFIQDNSKLINCFITGKYSYYQKQNIETIIVRDFYKMITYMTPIKQRILFLNIYTRLATVPIKPDTDELPF